MAQMNLCPLIMYLSFISTADMIMLVNRHDNNNDVLYVDQKYLLSHPRHLSSVVDEHHFINDTFEQIQ